jgi:phosphatidate cytidylyltransferase
VSESVPASRRSWADLGPRLISAVVLIPLTAIALYLGGWFFAIVVAAVFAGAYREWDVMVTLKPLTPLGMALIAAVFVAGAQYPLFGTTGIALVAIVAAAVALAIGGEGRVWRAIGIVYFAIVIAAVLLLRGTAPLGIWAGVILGTVIWGTDSGAFFVGRVIGGEKLAPGISPGKTWSGAIGGFVTGTVLGTILWHFVAGETAWWIALGLCAATSILGQLGDLAESALKRRFRVKDSGDIIPGHGGLMDRLDSVTFGVIFLTAVGLWHMGGAEVAQGILDWH